MNDQILTEIRELRKDFNTYARDMESRTAVLESEMHSLMGNGQPGRITLLERAVDRLNGWKWWLVGVAAGCSSLMGVIGWFLK
jgi:hypothetical protein